MKNSDGFHLSVKHYCIANPYFELIVASFNLIRQVAPLYATDTVNRFLHGQVLLGLQKHDSLKTT